MERNNMIRSEWKPQVLGQCNSWLKDGLRPRAMTRDLDWGVPVPLPGADGKVLYVWLDAPDRLHQRHQAMGEGTKAVKPIGRSGGRPTRRVCSISSARTTSFSTASSSRSC